MNFISLRVLRWNSEYFLHNQETEYVFPKACLAQLMKSLSTNISPTYEFEHHSHCFSWAVPESLICRRWKKFWHARFRGAWPAADQGGALGGLGWTSVHKRHQHWTPELGEPVEVDWQWAYLPINLWDFLEPGSQKIATWLLPALSFKAEVIKARALSRCLLPFAERIEHACKSFSRDRPTTGSMP